MGEFFRVKSLMHVLSGFEEFAAVDEEELPLDQAGERVLSRTIRCQEDLPSFARSTMDGYAVRARDTFGASESMPAVLEISGEIGMGEAPARRLEPGRAVRIATGGALPTGADAVVMVEYTEILDARTLEIYRAVAPGENTVARGEDVKKGADLLAAGRTLRPQEIGLLAALGHERIWVHRRPVVAIVSTGDEIVSIDSTPGPGQVRDVNGPALEALVRRSGGVPLGLGIVPDDRQLLETRCRDGLRQADCLLLSGGSSVGTRDFSLEVLESLEGSETLAHGIAVKPGKPTLVAKVAQKPLVGLPGHPASALVIFHVLVRPLLDRLSGRRPSPRTLRFRARLARNLASAQGREDFVRVSLIEAKNELWAKPVLGASGLLRTLVEADGLIRIDPGTEGLEQGTWVDVETLL
jgi:molybdopterin molybdotransferase